mgnify:FL=1
MRERGSVVRGTSGGVDAREPMDLSIVIPLHDEEDNVPLLYPRIVEACAPLGVTFEVIFVDDCSRDRTWEVMNALEPAAGELVLVQLRANRGQTPAMAAGFEVARGEHLVTMDGDLQNDPSDIPALLALAKDHDMVCGWRKNRQDKLWSRKIPSKCANWLIRKLTKVTISDYGCSLKVYKRALVRRMRLYSDMHRVLPFISQQVGGSVTELPVKHHARMHGRTKYGLGRIWKVLADLLGLKVLVHYYRRLFMWFALMALPVFVAFAALLHMSLGAPQETRQTVVAITAVVGTLGLFIVLLGLVSELVLKSEWKEFDRLLVVDDRTGDVLE